MKLVVNEAPKQQRLTFSQLEVGDVFRCPCDTDVRIKLDDGSNLNVTVRVISHAFSADSTVVLLDATLTVNGDLK